MNIANGVRMGNDPIMWLWKSLYGDYLKLDYMLHSKSLRSFDISSNLEIDMDSNHRNVYTSIEFLRSNQNSKLRRSTVTRWTPTMDSFRGPSNYHSHLQRLMDEYPPDNLYEFGNTQ